MKRMATFFLLFAMVVLSGRVQAGDEASQRFEKIKTLVGTWQGNAPKGGTTHVSYEVVSNGSVVMERMRNEDEPEMVTMYHLDGDKLMMTHYCSAMNQPRMKAESNTSENVLSFMLMDITNLAKETDGHMRKMVMTIKDNDHITHEWTFANDGKEMVVPFDLTRVKMSQK